MLQLPIGRKFQTFTYDRVRKLMEGQNFATVPNRVNKLKTKLVSEIEIKMQNRRISFEFDIIGI